MSPAVMRALIAKGFTSEDIADITECLAVDELERVAHQRERNRINQQNHRARKRVTGDIGDSGDMTIEINREKLAETLTAKPGTPIAQESLLLTESESKKERKKTDSRKRLTPFPPEFVLDGEPLRFALDQGWPSTRAKAEWGRFRDHALGHDRRQKDWLAAWRNWVTSPYQKQNTVDLKTRKQEEWDNVRARLRASIERDDLFEASGRSAIRLFSPELGQRS